MRRRREQKEEGLKKMNRGTKRRVETVVNKKRDGEKRKNRTSESRRRMFWRLPGQEEDREH